MSAVEVEMKTSNRAIHKDVVGKCVELLDRRLLWIENNLGMAVITAGQIWWTWDVEDAMDAMAVFRDLSLTSFAF